MMSEQMINNAYWVIRGRLLAGEYPGDLDEVITRSRLRWLLRQGITLFLDLTEADEPGLVPYTQFLLEEASFLGVPAAHVRIPTPDFNTPTSEEMMKILNTLDRILKSGQHVYLHCHGGIGRTGTVVGCYLRRYGTEGQEALDQIDRWRAETPYGYRSSPETEEQKTFVLNWRQGE